MDIIIRIMMTLTGLILGMLGMITAIHSDYYLLGILISFAGLVTMLSGLGELIKKKIFNYQITKGTDD